MLHMVSPAINVPGRRPVDGNGDRVFLCMRERGSEGAREQGREEGGRESVIRSRERGREREGAGVVCVCVCWGGNRKRACMKERELY